MLVVVMRTFLGRRLGRETTPAGLEKQRRNRPRRSGDGRDSTSVDFAHLDTPEPVSDVPPVDASERDNRCRADLPRFDPVVVDLAERDAGPKYPRRRIAVDFSGA